MALTSDEWTVSGIENAEMAESSDDQEESKTFLDKAVFCFHQAKDTTLGRKARTHRSSVLFRWKVVRMDQATASLEAERLEVEASRLMKPLLEEGLGGEANKLGETILPLLNPVSQEKLQLMILSKLLGIAFSP